MLAPDVISSLLHTNRGCLVGVVFLSFFLQQVLPDLGERQEAVSGTA